MAGIETILVPAAFAFCAAHPIAACERRAEWIAAPPTVERVVLLRALAAEASARYRPDERKRDVWRVADHDGGDCEDLVLWMVAELERIDPIAARAALAAVIVTPEQPDGSNAHVVLIVGTTAGQVLVLDSATGHVGPLEAAAIPRLYVARDGLAHPWRRLDLVAQATPTPLRTVE